MRQRLTLFLDRRPGLVALVAGGLSATGFAPLGLWPVTLLCFALLIHLVSRRSRLRGAFGTGWLFGLGHFTVGLNWIATAFTFQAAMPAWIGWLAVPLLSLYLALFPALAAAGAWWLWQWAARKGHRARHPGEGRGPSDSVSSKANGHPMDSRLRGNDEAYFAFALWFAPLWVLTEWLRSWVFTGFAWNPLSAIASWAAAPASVIGSYGMSGLVVIAAAGAGLAGYGQWRCVGKLCAGLALFLGLLWLASGLNAFLLPSSLLPREIAPQVTIIQPNIEQGDKWDFAARAENFAKLARLTARPDDTTPRLILWPEAAVPDYLEDGYPPDWYDVPPDYARARIAALLGPDDLLLTGAVKLEPNRARTDITGARNAVFAINARGELGSRYDKAHLVPWGEYLPMRPVLSAIGLSRLVPGSVDFLEGPGARTIDLGRFGRAGVQICYEIIFSGQVVDRADRPDFIFNPSNDAWFGSWGPPQHLAQARLRAIEEGLPVLRATPTGISAVIDARGNIVEQVPMHRAGAITTTLPEAREATFFARHGNAVPVAISLLMLFLLAWPALLPLVARRRAR